MAFVTFALYSCNFTNILWMAGNQGLRISYLQECLFYHAIIRIINAGQQRWRNLVWLLNVLKKIFFYSAFMYCIIILWSWKYCFLNRQMVPNFFPIIFAKLKFWIDILLTFSDILYRNVFNWDWDLSVQAVATEPIIKVHVFYPRNIMAPTRKNFIP